jgi:hypothetical protein
VAPMRRRGESGARILLHYPSRHSAGQPIVAGWAYQFVAQLGFERDSWVAPVDAKRVKPAQNTDQVAAEQVRALVARLPNRKPCPSSSSMPATIR